MVININKKKYAEIGQQMRAIPPEKTIPTHEWEELVQRMCNSDDDGLRDIGIVELSVLRK